MTIWTPEISRDEGAPLYRAIANAIEADVQRGALSPGDRLPPQRELADQLGVTTGTVSRAYAEAERAGWVRGEVGRGTFVQGGEDEAARPLRGGFEQGVVDLSVNLPIARPEPDLAEALRALARDPSRAGLMAYQTPEGRAVDREAGAVVLEAHGLPAAAGDVVVCAGSQHGLSVALQAIANPGDVVAAEALCYPGFRAFAASRGLRVRPVAMDAEGIVPEAFDELCRTARPKALYVTPTLQNPTNATLGSGRREQIAELALRHDVFVVEDDIHRMLAPDAPAPISSHLPDHGVYVASLSKSLTPGLRVGYLRAPAALRTRIIDEVWASLWMVSPVSSAIASHWIGDGTFARIAAGKRAAAAERQTLAREKLAGLSLRDAAASYHVWLELPGEASASGFVARARARGVAVTGSDAFWLGSGPSPAAVRVSLSSEPELKRLGEALERIRAVAQGHEEANAVGSLATRL